jgi:hypothetical protein
MVNNLCLLLHFGRDWLPARSSTRHWGAKSPLIEFMGFPFFLARTRVKALSTQAHRIPLIRAFPRGQPLGAQSEASPARLGKERETPRCFHARAIIPLTVQPLLFHTLSCLTLLPKPADGFSSIAENCTDKGGPASSLLHRRLAMPCIVVGEQASLHQPDFNRRLLCNVVKHPQSPSSTVDLPSYSS